MKIKKWELYIYVLIICFAIQWHTHMILNFSTNEILLLDTLPLIILNVTLIKYKK